MLIEFKFKNFKSFKDEQVFSLVASPDNNLSENVTSPENFGKQRLVNSAVIYGANASGKSNIIQALRYVEQFILRSFIRPIGSETGVRPFLLDVATASNPTEFEIHFIYQNVRYQYGFTLDNKRVYQEWLIAYPKGQPQTWFERNPKTDSDESEWYFGSKFSDKKLKLQDNTRPDALFLSTAAQNNSKQLLGVLNWFLRCLLIIDITQEIEVYEQVNKRRLLQDENYATGMKALIQQLDLEIVDYQVQEEVKETAIPDNFPNELLPLYREINALTSKINQPSVSVQFKHQYGEQAGAGVFLPWQDESFGTRRLFALSAPLLDVLEGGRVLVVDELDASLHPILVRALVRLFHNPQINKNGAQLIFNTHDTTLQDLTLLRRDQIWFVEKSNGASSLVPYLEYSPRDKEALQKGYLQGRYGAIPFISEALLSEPLAKESSIV